LPIYLQHAIIRITNKYKEYGRKGTVDYTIGGNEALYKLTSIILKEFNITNSEQPQEIKTIGSSLLAINQSIEKIRSEKTDFHGKTSEDLLIKDAIYTYFVVNCVSTVGLFLHSYYRTRFPKSEPETNSDGELPF